jgi:hypothetical protein
MAARMPHTTEIARRSIMVDESGWDFMKNTLAARGLEERRNFEDLLIESVGRVRFS